MQLQELTTATRAPLWTAATLARFLSVSPRTIRRWRSQGRIPYVETPGGTYRYDPAQVEEVLVEHTASDYARHCR